MTETTDNTHIVRLSRRLIKRLEIGASHRAHFASDINTRRDAQSFERFFARLLSTRDQEFDLRGTASYFFRMAWVCGDALAAFEMGRQLECEA